jgi:LysM repeat protein
MVVVLTLSSAAIMFRIAGLGVGAAISPFRGSAPPAAARPPQGTAPAGQPTAAGQQPAAQPTAPSQPAPTAPAGAQPTTAAAAAPTTAPTQPTVAPSPTTRPGQREHTVQSGDTLFAIAQRYNTTIPALVAANNLRDSSVTLSIGQRLIIP